MFADYMELRLETDDGTIIYPAIKAAAKFMDDGTVEVKSDRLRIKGVDAANVARFEVTIPAEAFSTYDVETGEFDTSFSRLWDAVREGKKGTPFTIYTKEPEYDDLDALPISRGDREVLEANGITTPAQLQDASDDEIMGEATYTFENYRGEETEKTATIEEKHLPKFRKPFRPMLAVEIDGEDPTDWEAPTDHPRVSPVEREFPAIEWDHELTLTVNGKDFSKAHRAIEKTRDTAYIGGIPDEDAMLVYGDLGGPDEVHAVIDADEISGKIAGSLYSAEYVKDLRLSVDRPASTDVTFKLSNERPLEAEFSIADTADVSIAIAPRVKGKDQDYEEPEDLFDRIRPSKYRPIGAEKLTVETTGGKAKDWFKFLNSHADELKLKIRENEISSRVVDPANVMMADFKLPRSAFDSYRYRSPGGLLAKHEGIIGFDLDGFVSMLPLFTKNETIKIAVDNDANLLVQGDHFTWATPTLDPDSVRQEPDLPGLELPGRAEVNAGDFIEGLKEADEISSHVDLIIFNGELYLGTEADTEHIVYPVETENGEGYAYSRYSLDYLADHYKKFPTDQNGETIEIYTGLNFPMLAYQEIHDGEFITMLAPRIHSDVDTIDAKGEYGDSIDAEGIDTDRIKAAEPRFEVNPDDSDTITSNEPKEPGPGSSPEEVAEAVREADEPDDTNVPGDGQKPYDPTDEWDPEGIAEEIDERRRAERREMERIEADVTLSPEELDPRWEGTVKKISNGDGQWIARDDAAIPKEEAAWDDMMEDIYGEDALEADPDQYAGWGAGRRRLLDAIEEKGTLDPIDPPERLADLIEAIEEIELDSPRYMNPPTGVIETIKSVHADLPDEAKEHYVKDEVLLRRINAARRQFNEWIGRKRRAEEIPSPAEAGPAKYPVKRARQTSRSERKAKEELNERIAKIQSGARGGKQRALNAIGSSVAELHEDRATDKAEEMREALEVGDIVVTRTTHHGVAPWVVKRVNKKSVRLIRPHNLAGQEKHIGDGVYPDYDEYREDLDSDWLRGPIPEDEMADSEHLEWETKAEAQMALAGQTFGEPEPEPEAPEDFDIPEEIGQWKLISDIKTHLSWKETEALKHPRWVRVSYDYTEDHWDAHQTREEYDDETNDLALGATFADALEAAVAYMEEHRDPPDHAGVWYGELDIFEGAPENVPVLTDEALGTTVELVHQIGDFELVRPSLPGTVAEYENGSTLRIIEAKVNGFVPVHYPQDVEAGLSRLSEPTNLTEAFSILEARAEALAGQPTLADVDAPEVALKVPDEVAGWVLVESTPESVRWEGPHTGGNRAVATDQLRVFTDEDGDIQRSLVRLKEDGSFHSKADHKATSVEMQAAIDLAVEWMREHPRPDAEPDEPEVVADVDLADDLVSLGVNRITANHLADNFGDIDALAQALAEADDPTDLPGVGEASAQQVLDAVRVEDIEPTKKEPIVEDRHPDIEFKRLKDIRGIGKATEEKIEAATAVSNTKNARTLYDMRNERDEWYTILDLLPSVTAKKNLLRAINVDEAPTPAVEIPEHVSGYNLDLEEDARIVWVGEDAPSAPASLRRDEPVTANVEIGGDPPVVYVAWEGTAIDGTKGIIDQDRIGVGRDREHAIELAVEWMQEHPAGQRERLDPDTPPDELPWYARRYLSGAWARYRRALSAGHEAAEAIEEYAEIRREGKEAAAEINEIRRQYGQEPIDFEGVPAIESVEGIEGELQPEDISHDFEWEDRGISRPYDPTEDVRRAIS